METVTGHLPLLRRYQSRTLLALLHGIAARPGATQTVLFPRQAGKNEVAASLVACLLLGNARRGGSVVVCAPTHSPQAEISQRRTLSALRTAARLLPAAATPRVEGATLRVGRASASFLSASPEANVAGHTASVALIADEAQDIDEDWFDRQFRPMAASTAAPAVLFGTPWDGETLLDRAVARNRETDSRAAPGTLTLHHETPWETVAAAVPAYGRYVRQERARLGATHPLFLTQYGLGCITAAGRLFTPEDLAAMAGGHEAEDGPSAGYRYVAGFDIGGEGTGSDASVLTIARVRERRCEAVAVVAWDGAAISLMKGEVQALAAHWGFARLCVDSTGIGQSIARDLERELGGLVEPVHFSAALKAELGYGLLAAARTGSLALPATDAPGFRTLRVELRSCRATYRGGLLQWEAPSGAHDDHAVSLALCVRAAGSLGPERIATGRRR
jgi:hypothetical protein